MKNNILSISMFSVILIIGGCTKEIKLKQLPYESKLSIECLITPNQIPKIFLNKTTPYLTGAALNSNFFARNAKITITSNLGSINFTPDSMFNFFKCDYIYFYKGSSPIIADTKYKLNILYEGNSYEAECKTDQAIVQISSISYVKVFKDLYGEHEGVVLNYLDPSLTGQYYRYEMHRWADSSAYKTNGGKIPCLNGTKIRTVEIGRTIYSDQNSNGQYSSIIFEPALKHKFGDTVYIQLQIMDHNAFDYYDQLDRQKLAQFNPFVEPSYLKPTQFRNAFGCFSAYNLSDSVLFVYPE